MGRREFLRAGSLGLFAVATGLIWTLPIYENFIRALSIGYTIWLASFVLLVVVGFWRACDNDWLKPLEPSTRWETF